MRKGEVGLALTDLADLERCGAQVRLHFFFQYNKNFCKKQVLGEFGAIIAASQRVAHKSIV